MIVNQEIRSIPLKTQNENEEGVIMKLWSKLFEATDEYAKQSKWTDISLLKTCLCATGVMIGLSVPKEKKRPVLIGAAMVYTATSIPIMMKFLPILKQHLNIPCTRDHEVDSENIVI